MWWKYCDRWDNQEKTSKEKVNKEILVKKGQAIQKTRKGRAGLSHFFK